ncbi:hypothetical protein GF068_03485 [Polyangium spumosum]|uniref:Uncharacterized protein n=2 Tax=Polyangium spumosum TaxID=889282 RepID=A0A6N7PGS3_9BACT|nr:hypothetical protein [Polyangium spumosum]
MLAPSGIAYAEVADPVACALVSRTPESHTFYGSGEELARKVSAANLPIHDRRLYLYTVETDKGAELVFFERVKGKEELEVSRWKGASLGDLKEQLNAVMMTNQGKYCIGKKSTDLINTKLELQPAGARAIPSSAGDLVRVSAEEQRGDFARVTFFLLC